MLSVIRINCPKCDILLPINMKVPAVPVIQAAAITDDIMAVKGIFVKQKIELLEVITGFETKNKYKVAFFLKY